MSTETPAAALGTTSAAPAAATAPRPAKKGSRLGATWVALGASTVILVLLLVFILENSQQAQLSYFGQTAHLQLGVLLLLGAVAGIVLTLLLGSLRIAQLKIRQRANR